MNGINMGRSNGKSHKISKEIFLNLGVHTRDVDSAIAWRKKYMDPSKTPPQFNRQNPVLVDMAVNERYLYIFPNGYGISLIWRNGVYNAPEVALVFWNEETGHFELSNRMMVVYDWDDSVRLVYARRELINILKQASVIKSEVKLSKKHIDYLRKYVEYKPVKLIPKYWLYEYLKDQKLDIDDNYPRDTKPGSVEFVELPDELIREFSPEFNKFQQNMETIQTLNKALAKDRERIFKEMEQSPLSGIANVMRKATEAFSGLASAIRVSQDIAHHLSDLYITAGYTVVVERDTKDKCLVKIDWRIEHI